MDYKVLHDKIVSRCIVASLLLFAITLVYTIVNFGHLGPFLPLYNQMSWGEPRIAPKIAIFIPFALLIGIFFVNFFFANIIYKSMPLISQILSVTTVLTAFLISLFIIRTIILVL